LVLNPVDGVAWCKETHKAPFEEEDAGADGGDKGMLDVDAAEGENGGDALTPSAAGMTQGEGGEQIAGGEGTEVGGSYGTRRSDASNGIEGAGGQAKEEGAVDVVMAEQEEGSGGGERREERGAGQGGKGDEVSSDEAAGAAP